MKKILATAAVAAVMASGAQAATATFDFVALAAGTPGDRGGVEGETFVENGLGVTLTSSHNAYLDDLSGGKPGGLGVCKTLDSDKQCVPSSDDNVTEGEWVTLTFSQKVDTLYGFSFNDGNHNDLSTSTDTLQVSGVDDFNPTFGPLDISFQTLTGSSAIRIFEITFWYGGPSPDQFYLSSITADFTPVPLPASALLLGGALGGLGLMRRRKSKS